MSLTMAYADPPYPRQARRHYDCDEVDHGTLIERLCTNFSDGWALSTSSPALREVLALCPEDVRVAAWVKPFASFKPGVNPAYAWEPVIWRGGRKRERKEWFVRDWVSVPVRIRGGPGEIVVGAKPPAFCAWLFDLLGLRPSDTFVDLYPGSGAVTSAWNRYCMSLDSEATGRGEPLALATPLFQEGVPGLEGGE